MNTALQAIESALRVLIRDCPAMAATDCQEALRASQRPGQARPVAGGFLVLQQSPVQRVCTPKAG